jgi:uncharacterized membrane protein (UPF0136 family)
MKPGRTLGLSLAIFASAMLFSILPMLQVAMLLIIHYRFQNTDLALPGKAVVNPIAIGGSFEGGSDASLIVQVVLGVIFLVIAVCAWRGRPPWIRFVMIAAVVLLTLVTAAFSITPLLDSPDVGIDSGAALRQTLLSGRMILSLLVALYVVWYVNRGPARAFYRGYYLSKPTPAEAQP